MYGLSSSNHDLAPANVQSVLTSMKIAVFRYRRLLIHQLSRPDVLQSSKNLTTAILMAVSTDCTLAGAKSWLEEERPYIRALNAAV